MRKIKLLSAIALSFMGLSAMAQSVDNSFSFVDAQGNVVADGSTITATELEYMDDGNGGYYQIPSGIYVKNNKDEIGYCSVAFKCTSKDNGSLSLCFPGSCMNTVDYGLEFENGPQPIKGSVTSSLATEWLPTGYGTATATYTLKIYNVDPSNYQDIYVCDGPTITVKYVFGTSDINNTVSDKRTTSTEYYDLSGRKIETPVKGVYVKVSSFSDGTKKSEKIVY